MKVKVEVNWCATSMVHLRLKGILVALIFSSGVFLTCLSGGYLSHAVVNINQPSRGGFTVLRKRNCFDRQTPRCLLFPSATSPQVHKVRQYVYLCISCWKYKIKIAARNCFQFLVCVQTMFSVSTSDLMNIFPIWNGIIITQVSCLRFPRFSDCSFLIFQLQVHLHKPTPIQEGPS